MSEASDDWHEAAGEYVLGTLSTAERAAFEARLEGDLEAGRAVAFWRERLAPLDDVAVAVEPPPALWSAIASALPPIDLPVPPAVNDNMRRLRASRNRWRGAAVAAALFAVAGAFVAVNEDARTRLGLPGVAGGGLGGNEYVAVVNRDGALPALLVNVDAVSGRVLVRALDLPDPAQDRSYELWYVPPQEKPISIGLMDGSDATLADIAPVPGGTFAVSEEARGGSSTGAPQGAIVYSGKLVKMPR